jgi:hypothetical protein
MNHHMASKAHQLEELACLVHVNGPDQHHQEILLSPTYTKKFHPMWPLPPSECLHQKKAKIAMH